jgi:hypothetical protein
LNTNSGAKAIANNNKKKIVLHLFDLNNTPPNMKQMLYPKAQKHKEDSNSYRKGSQQQEEIFS